MNKSIIFCLVGGLVLMTNSANANSTASPFPVGPDQKEPSWQNWGYEVDGQTWGHWLDVDIRWSDICDDGEAIGILKSDFLLRVDPKTSGLANPSSVYGENWWNHDDIYGLGEFFDNEEYTLRVNTNTSSWSLTYLPMTTNHTILEGSIDSYCNRNGYFYGILSDYDGRYDGYFSASHDEGNPLLVPNNLHTGNVSPIPACDIIPAPGALLLGSIGAGFVGWLRRRRTL